MGQCAGGCSGATDFLGNSHAPVDFHCATVGVLHLRQELRFLLLLDQMTAEPRWPRSIASVNPTGPAPTIRTSVSKVAGSTKPDPRVKARSIGLPPVCGCARATSVDATAPEKFPPPYARHRSKRMHRIGSNVFLDRGRNRLRYCNMRCWPMSQMGPKATGRHGNTTRPSYQKPDIMRRRRPTGVERHGPKY